ncbi:Bacteriophage CI repressor helix-turn-helix domain protein [compost metagenome]|jgi:hypothetical protein|uniref:helix-turn-helix domain containing protein n=1 Tax=Pseudomonas putida TaxID=303 RepID=UPI000FB3D038|nr:helix-turn-helix domain containing protein [Pseudomonas putida]
MSTGLLAPVLARLKLLTGCDTDAELSRALSISPQTLSSWKVRDSIPYAICVESAKHYACSLDWLLLGEATPKPMPQGPETWETDMLERLRALSVTDRQAILLLIQDKQRIQQLERQLTELAKRIPDDVRA